MSDTLSLLFFYSSCGSHHPTSSYSCNKLGPDLSRATVYRRQRVRARVKSVCSPPAGPVDPVSDAPSKSCLVRCFLLVEVRQKEQVARSLSISSPPPPLSLYRTLAIWFRVFFSQWTTPRRGKLQGVL